MRRAQYLLSQIDTDGLRTRGAIARGEFLGFCNHRQHRFLQRSAIHAEHIEQLPRSGFQQGWRKDVQGSEGHPYLSQERSHLLRQMLDPRSVARNVTMPGNEIEQQSARLRPGIRIACRMVHLFERLQRLELLVEPFFQPGHQIVARIFGQCRHFTTGFQHWLYAPVATFEFGQNLALPPYGAACQLDTFHVCSNQLVSLRP